MLPKVAIPHFSQGILGGPNLLPASILWNLNIGPGLAVQHVSYRPPHSLP